MSYNYASWIYHMCNSDLIFHHDKYCKRHKEQKLLVFIALK